MRIDITEIVTALIALCAALITGYLIPWIKEKTTEKQQAVIWAATKIAVCAAEQIFGNGNGDSKYEYAINLLHGWGFDVDKAEVESAVYEHINKFKNMLETIPPGEPPKAGE